MSSTEQGFSRKSYTVKENLLKFLWQDQKGQDLTEYALLLALIALGAIASMKTIASTINGVYASAASKIAAP